MGARTGKYSRFIFDEAKRYVATLLQVGVPLVDADYNDFTESFVAQVKRFIQFTVGSGSPNDGFKIEEASSNTNNFKIKGGDGTINGAGRIFVNGFQGILVDDIDFLDDEKEIHAPITGLVDAVLTDSAANFDVNELVGRDLVPNIANPGTTFTILSNTARTITVSSGLLGAAAVGKFYRVNPSTPGGSPPTRTDVVFLDCYLDEVDSTEDPDLIHNFVVPTEAMRRLKVRQIVRIKEDAIAAPPSFTDFDGNFHETLLLTTVVRNADDDQITTAMITDERPLIADLLSFKNELANARASDLLGTFGTLDARIEAAEDRFDLVANTPLQKTTPGGIITLDLPNATQITAGALSGADKTKLDGIQQGNINGVQLMAGDADIFSAGTVTTETETDKNDADIYATVTGDAADQDAKLEWTGIMFTSEISKITVPHKFSAVGGNASITIRVIADDGSGTVVATKSGSILDTTRTETIILSADLSAQPTDRFIIEVEVTVDNTVKASIGTIKIEFA